MTPSSSLKHLARKSYNRARQARVIMRLSFGLAVPARDSGVQSSRQRGAAPTVQRPAPAALTPVEINAAGGAIAFWERGQSASVPNPDGQLGLLVEVMLGTSARIGEALALRHCDVDITSAPATIRIAGTVVDAKGASTMRQDHPKTSRSRRTVVIPTFAAAAIRQRLIVMADRLLDALMFSSREGHRPCPTTSAGSCGRR